MEKFHYFLYGKEFTLETDQKPLVSIYKKHMVDISLRVQRLIVRTFPYLPFKVVYKKRTDIPVADALSQVTPVDPEDNIQLPIITINMITTQILMSVESQSSFSNKLDQLRKSTAQDNQLTRLRCYINTGFPYDKKNLPTDLPVSWSYKELLPSETGLINCETWIIKMICQYVHREFYILPRPLKAMTKEKFRYMHKAPLEQKEVYILSRPMLPDCGTPSLQPMANCSIASPLQLITQHTPREKDLPQLPSTLGAQEIQKT